MYISLWVRKKLVKIVKSYYIVTNNYIKVSTNKKILILFFPEKSGDPFNPLEPHGLKTPCLEYIQKFALVNVDLLLCFFIKLDLS